VLYALISLDLIDEGGLPTPTLESLRLAPDIFAIVDPTKDDETRVRDAFRGYNPVGQQARMVSLFLGLCANAGMISDKPASAPRPRPAAPRASAPPPRSAPLRFVAAAKAGAKNLAKNPSGLPPALAGLLESLPDASDGWTAADRDKFLTAFKVVLDFCIPVVAKTRAKDEMGDAAASG
jgi:hypothetical protein